MKEIKALGEHVILVSTPKRPGQEKLTESGIFTGYEVQGEVPQFCTVYSVGSDVPEGYAKVGDVTALPNGSVRNVPHPDVVSGKRKDKDVAEKFVVCHYKTLPCIYS